ncbi:MAG: protein phosphatase CheZ [Rickettsiales bacterium]
MTDSVVVNKWSNFLREELEAVGASNTSANKFEEKYIGELVQQFVAVISSYVSIEQRQDIYTQLHTILEQVEEVKQETIYMGEDIIKDGVVPDIAVELHSVIAQTENSVQGILDVSDAIREISKKDIKAEIKEDLVCHSVKLLELCNFQDLTGQIINRIIKRLTSVETAVGDIFHMLRQDPRVVLNKPKSKCREEDKLLNGPQKEAERPTQSEVDDLFNSV